jgi:predicted Fe-Mo cluster-binding NifX family protein
MKAAFAVWNDRIAPVFDTARRICLVEADAGRIVHKAYEPLTDNLPVRRALLLSEFGVDTLICGAISKSLSEIIASHGIRVISFVAGDLHEMIKTWLAGDCDWKAFAMPGCCRRTDRRH